MLPDFLDHLLQSTLFAAAAGLLTLAFRKNRAQTRYGLWLAASVKFLIPLSLLVDAGSYFGHRTATPDAQSSLSSAIEQVSQPFAAPVPLLAVPPAAHSSSTSWIPVLVLAVWAIGFVTLVFAWGIRWRTLRAALRTASRLDLSIDIHMDIMSNRRVRKLTSAQRVALVAAGVSALAAPIVVGILNAPAIRAQSPLPAQSAKPAAKFEVASIKPCKSDPAPVPGKKGGRGGAGQVRWTPGRLDVECRSVANLIRYAYLSYADGKPWLAVSRYDDRGLPPISPRQFASAIRGGPAWVDSERYTIEAKADGPATREMMNGPMMQALLEERFQLHIRRQTEEIPVYELTVANGGPKLQPSQEGSCIDMRGPDFHDPGPGQPFPRVCGGFAPGKNGGTDFFGATFTALCRNLSVMFDRDVVDKTGLTGLFDFHFDTHPVESGADAPPPGDPEPRPSAADREERNAQLRSALPKMGLKLEAAKGSGVFLVIDHVERPSGN